jgi:hypothetical protein
MPAAVAAPAPPLTPPRRVPTFPAVKTEGIARHVFFAAAIALAFYVAGFVWIEHLNHRKGPWEIQFRTDAAGHPSLTVFQPTLGISNVTVTVADRTMTNLNFAATVRFDSVTNTAPVGELIYFDTMALPGVVTFHLLGHEVEFMPRTMIVNKQEIPWAGPTNIVLTGEGKYTPRPPTKKRF